MARESSPAVLNGATAEAIVLRTSVSALTAFDPESYAGCHRRWWFTRVAGVKEEETVAQGIGKESHAQAEHYEKTGEDILGPVVRAGRKFLLTGPDVIVEAQFGKLAEAVKLRRAGAPVGEIEKAAGLCAGGIPLDGYIDFRHARQNYIDADGTLRREDPRHGRVVEVGDHKTTSSIEAFAKSPSEMASTIQMIGYANYVLNVESAVDHVRLSHIYYQTRGALMAKKITALVSAQNARTAWKRVDQLGLQMQQVAKLSRIEEVEANTNSCKAYRGCPHVSRCPVTRTFTSTGGSMSLFNKPANGTNGTQPPAPPAPVPSGSLFGAKKSAPAANPQYDAAKEAEKARLAAADVSYGTCMCGMALTGLNISKLTSGEIKHIGCPRAGVVPGDAPKPVAATAAVPMTPEQIAQVEDPEVRQRAVDHAALHQQHAPEAPGAKGGRCPAGGTQSLLTDKEKVSRKKNCPHCGVERKVKDDEFSEDFTRWNIPKHNLPKVEAASAPITTPPVAAPVASTGASTVTVLPQPVPTTPTVPGASQSAQGIIPLEDYYLPMVRELEERGGAADLRCAPNDSELAFGKWKGALSAYVRANPPATGIYIARSNDEIAMEVVNTLRPLCAVGGIMLFIDVAIERGGAVVRGVR